MTKKNNNNYRLKVTTACQNCQRRKIKCSGEVPCKYCSKVDKKCEPGKPGKKRGPPPGQEVIRNRGTRIEYVHPDKLRGERRSNSDRSSSSYPPGARIPLPPRIPPGVRPIPPDSRFPNARFPYHPSSRYPPGGYVYPPYHPSMGFRPGYHYNF